MTELGNHATAGEVLALVRSGTAVTRTDIARITGLSRTAVASRVAALARLDLVTEGQIGPSTGGRPPTQLRFNTGAGVVAATALGRSRLQTGICDLGGRLLAHDDLELDVTAGPDEVMPRVTDQLGGLLATLDRSPADVRGFGCSIPGTVDLERGASLDSPLMAQWAGVELAPYLHELAKAPVHVDNDATVLALSERDGHLRHHRDLIAVKASTGLGAGVVADGRVLRGGRGAAGEIGHVRSPAADQLPCRCGDAGCLETVAAGWALVQTMSERGRPVTHVRELVALAIAGDATARALVREAGRRVGEVMATAVTLLNPTGVVIGGDMAPAYDTFAAGLRETLYANATAFATKDLQILQATHGALAGLIGCGALALENILSPGHVDRVLAGAAAAPR